MSRVLGLAFGVFDLFHVGHLRYLQAARQRCDALLVGLTPDEVGHRVKGKWPIIPQDQRCEIVAGLACVDGVRLLPTTLDDTDAAAEWIPQWGVHRVFPGAEWMGSERWRRLSPRLQAQGIEVYFMPHTPGVSTSLLMNRLRTGA